MPHLVVERIRSVGALCPCGMCVRCPGRPKRRDAVCAYTLEFLDILGCLTFLIGSVCMLPCFSGNLPVFLVGCALFIVGSVCFFGICCFCMTEAVRAKSWNSFEVCENALYLIGSCVFVAGTVLYWPPEAHHAHVNWLVRRLSLGVYFNLFTPEFEGTVLFIFGSVLFALAAFVNGLDQRAFNTVASQMLTATTSLYMGGSLLFVMGSVAFLPDLGCNERMFELGAWCYVVGSSLYLLGSMISLLRTSRELENPVRSPLTGGKDDIGKP